MADTMHARSTVRLLPLRLVPLRLIPFLLLPLLAGGCDGLAGPVEALDVVMRVDPAIIMQGDTARIEITVQNASDQRIALHAGSCESIMRTEVLDLQGNVVVTAVPRMAGSSICVTSSSVIFDPAEPMRFERRWTGEAHFPSWDVDQSAAVEPGEYRVVVTFLASGNPVARGEAIVEVVAASTPRRSIPPVHPRSSRAAFP